MNKNILANFANLKTVPTVALLTESAKKMVNVVVIKVLLEPIVHRKYASTVVRATGFVQKGYVLVIQDTQVLIVLKDNVRQIATIKENAWRVPVFAKKNRQALRARIMFARIIATAEEYV